MNLQGDNIEFHGDIRKLASGRLRIRFKLSSEAEGLVANVFGQAVGNHPHTRLEHLCLDYLTSGACEISCKLPSCCVGNRRFLVKLYPDQVELVFGAFELAKTKFTGNPSAEQLLVYLCAHHSSVNKCYTVH